MYYTLDGRHRLFAANLNGIRELRCDVITQSGHALRVIPVAELQVDPDVQFDWAFSERKARAIAADWSDRKVGVLTVTLAGDGQESLSVAERASIKKALDGERRRISALESFLASVKEGDPRCLAMQAAVQANGFEIGRLSGGEPKNRVEAVAVLNRIFDQIGTDGLRRTFALNTRWLNDPKSNHGYWIEALSLLVRDGYDETVTPQVLAKWSDIVPALEIRRALGAVESAGGRAVAYEIASALRRKGRMKRLPVIQWNPKASRGRQL